jgi:hypothetical protein
MYNIIKYYFGGFMNCFNHPEEVAVANCVDCGKGLCKKCASLYQTPICNECNLKRVKTDKGNLIRVYVPSIVLFIPWMLWGIANGSLLMGLAVGFIFAGIPWGWKVVTFIQPKMFLFLSFGGWVVYFLIKLVISCFFGIVALPIGLVKLIIGLVSANKKEQNINNNLATEQ